MRLGVGASIPLLKIDRATSWVFLQIKLGKTAASARIFWMPRTKPVQSRSPDCSSTTAKSSPIGELYNRHPPQSALQGRTPIQAMKNGTKPIQNCSTNVHTIAREVTTKQYLPILAPGRRQTDIAIFLHPTLLAPSLLEPLPVNFIFWITPHPPDPRTQ